MPVRQSTAVAQALWCHRIGLITAVAALGGVAVAVVLGAPVTLGVASVVAAAAGLVAVLGAIHVVRQDQQRLRDDLGELQSLRGETRRAMEAAEGLSSAMSEGFDEAAKRQRQILEQAAEFGEQSGRSLRDLARDVSELSPDLAALEAHVATLKASVADTGGSLEKALDTVQSEQQRARARAGSNQKVLVTRLTQMRSVVGRTEALVKDVHAGHLQPHRQPMGRPRVLFMSSNGAGLGHLTRLMAVAERMDVEGEFLTMSMGHGLASYRGHRVTYFPSASASGMEGPVWRRSLTAFLRAVMAERQPDLVVFDGTAIYEGVTHASRIASVPLVWIQRGCWKAERDRSSPQRHAAAEFCDAVVLPGDYGCVESPDLGGNVRALPVPPITLLDREDLVDAATAREELGLADDRRYVLVQLGAGNINETTDLRQAAIRAVTDLGPDWVPVVVHSPIAKEKEQPDGAVSVEAYPVARHFAAFEFAVGAGGYNFVQECAGLGLPAVLVPNPETVTDDQLRRVRGVVELGVAAMAETPDELRLAISDVGRRLPSMRQALDRLEAPSGGVEAATALHELLDVHRKAWLPPSIA